MSETTVAWPPIAISAGIAILLSMLPLPLWLIPFWPYWLALVMIYWGLETNRMIGLGQAFLLGLLLDLASGTLLGQHGLSLLVLAYLLGLFRHRIRFFPPWQQILAIFALLLNDRIIQLWVIIGSQGQLPGWDFWLTPLTGAVLWPWLFLSLDYLRSYWRQRRT
ncbi:MAG: rod shape-determining protein MreD [Wenzhouxiangellaceae bacterium]